MLTHLRAVLTQHRAVLAISIAYLLLASAYNLANPLFEAPDELLHYQFIRTLQAERKLPEVDPSGPLTEYHQPPLYYALTALVAPTITDNELEPYTRVNPFWGYEIGAVGRDNKNQYLHRREVFPFSHARRVVHLVRAVSTLCGLITIVCAYGLASRLLPQPLAAASAAMVAFTPNFLLTSGAITNDALLITISTAAGWLILTLSEAQQAPSIWQWAALAGLLGLGMLTKLSFWPILPVAGLAAIRLAIRLRSWRVVLTASMILTIGVAATGGWWMLRNLRLYGDPTGLSSMWSVWGVRPPLTGTDYLIELRNFRTTFWANFGYGNVPAPGWVYNAIDFLSIASIAGLVAAGIRRGHGSVWIGGRGSTALMAAWALLTLGALIWYLQRTFSVTGRQLYPVLPLIGISLVAGWAVWWPSRWPLHWLSGLIVAGMLAFACGSLIGVLQPAYAPAKRVLAAAGSIDPAHRSDWDLGNGAIILRGYDLSPTVVRPGETVMLTLYWEPQRPLGENYTVFVHLFGEDGAIVGSRDTYPGLGNDPTIYWTPGQIVIDRIPIPIKPEATGPILLDIEAGLYVLETGSRLPIIDASGQPVGYPIIGVVKLADESPATAEEAPALRWEFVDGTALTGVAFSTETPSPGSELTVVLNWQPAGPLTTSHKVFIHVVDMEGNIVAQSDAMPKGGRYPTPYWAKGESFEDVHIIQLPPALKQGSYHVLIGLYDPLTGTRWPLQQGGDHVILREALSVP